MNSRFPGGGGSRRDDTSHRAVLDAARELLVEHGYEKLTVEAIAQRAQVAKPTIYRWWPNKAAIVDEAVWAPRGAPIEDTGDFEVDLRAHVERAVEFFAHPATVAALPGFLSGAFTGDPESGLARHTRAGIAPMRAMLQRAQQRGALTADLDIGMTTDMVVGGIISRVLARSLVAGQARGTKPSDTDALLSVLRTGLSLSSATTDATTESPAGDTTTGAAAPAPTPTPIPASKGPR